MTRPKNKFLESLYLELEELKKVDSKGILICEVSELMEKKLEIDLISFLNAGYDGEWREQNGDKIFYAQGFFFNRNVLISKEYPQLLRKLDRLYRLTNNFNKKRVELEQEILRGKKETLKEKRKLIEIMSLLTPAMQQEIALVAKHLGYDLKKYNAS